MLRKITILILLILTVAQFTSSDSIQSAREFIQNNIYVWSETQEEKVLGGAGPPRSGLVVDVDQVELQVEGQFQAVGQLHFVVAAVAVDLPDGSLGIEFLGFLGDLRRNDALGNACIAAIDAK